MTVAGPAPTATRLPAEARVATRTLLILGSLCVAASVLLGHVEQDHWHTFLRSYLVAFVFFLGLTLAALFFVLLHHLGRAGWSVVVRRLAECMAANATLMLILILPLVVGMDQLYEWTHAPAEDLLLAGKTPYLNRPFFMVRLALYFLVWIGLASHLFGLSLAQDRTGDPQLSLRMEKVSAPGMVLLAFTVTFAAFDLLMSLTPHWYSTIYGVYYFTGSVVGLLGVLIIAVYLLQRQGLLRGLVTREHYHDLGKLLFAFTCFWAYIAFSQYMLIWYANIPEETAFYQPRHHGTWARVGVLGLALGHFLVPFLAIMSRHIKRRAALLALAALWMLAMHWLDMCWLVQPVVGHGGGTGAEHATVHLSLLDLTCFLGLGGLWTGLVLWRLRRVPLVPLQDPRLPESLAFVNV